MPKAIVFANTEKAFENLWGMTLLEKILRQLSQEGFSEATVVSQQGIDFRKFLRNDFADWTDIRLNSQQMLSNEVETVEEIVREDDSHFVVIQGNGVYDGRIFAHRKSQLNLGSTLSVAQNDPGPSPYVFSVNRQRLSKITGQKPRSVDRLPDALKIQVVRTDEMDCYIKKLRRRMVPYMIRIDDREDLRRAEKSSFTSVYKGATDFVTKYVFPGPVRLAVKLISPTGITPNQLTVLSMFFSFGAIPLFFTGWFWTAIFMGLFMGLLDSIDGKLARLTLRISAAGDLMDHASDVVYLAFWYLGVGWYLSGGEMLNFSNNIVLATWILFVFYFVDRAVLGLFKKIFKAELHDYTKLDFNVRIYVARRNPFLVVMLIAMIVGEPVYGLYGATLWTSFTFLFHLIRFVYLPLSGKKHQSMLTVSG